YLFFLLLSPPPSISPLFPYTTLFRSALDRQLVLDERIDPLRRSARQFRQRWPAVTEDPRIAVVIGGDRPIQPHRLEQAEQRARRDRKSTRLNSSHDQISYAVFCLKKK